MSFVHFFETSPDDVVPLPRLTLNFHKKGPIQTYTAHNGILVYSSLCEDNYPTMRRHSLLGLNSTLPVLFCTQTRLI